VNPTFRGFGVAPTLNHSDPFTRHGTPKRLQASTRRLGDYRYSRQPSCTSEQAKAFAFKDAPPKRYSVAA
jgi:hypothetical protein